MFILRNHTQQYLTHNEQTFGGVFWSDFTGEKTVDFKTHLEAETFIKNCGFNRQQITIIDLGEGEEPDLPPTKIDPPATWYAEQASNHLRVADQCDIMTEASLMTAIRHCEFAAAMFKLAIAKSQGELFPRF